MKHLIFNIILFFFITSSFATAKSTLISSPLNSKTTSYNHHRFNYNVIDNTPLKYITNCEFYSCIIKNLKTPHLFHSSSKNNIFSGTLFDTIQLNNAHLTGFQFFQTTFENSHLKATIFDQAKFYLTSFKNSSLSSIVFYNSSFEKSDFSQSKITNVILLNSTLDAITKESLKGKKVIIGFEGLENHAKNKSVLQELTFFKILFKKRNLNYLTFKNTTFNFCNFNAIALRNTKIIESTLYQSIFNEIQAYKMMLSSSTLNTTTVNDSNFENTEFINSTFKNTEFKNVNFDQSLWKNTRIINSKFINCSFENIITTNLTIINSPSFGKSKN